MGSNNFGGLEKENVGELQSKQTLLSDFCVEILTLLLKDVTWGHLYNHSASASSFIRQYKSASVCVALEAEGPST